jgi:hypothetical protein
LSSKPELAGSGRAQGSLARHSQKPPTASRRATRARRYFLGRRFFVSMPSERFISRASSLSCSYQHEYVKPLGGVSSSGWPHVRMTRLPPWTSQGSPAATPLKPGGSGREQATLCRCHCHSPTPPRASRASSTATRPGLHLIDRRFFVTVTGGESGVSILWRLSTRNRAARSLDRPVSYPDSAGLDYRGCDSFPPAGL